MTYVSLQAGDMVLSREAMETLGLVKNLDDRKEASVRHLSTTPVNGGDNRSVPVEEVETPRLMGSGSLNSCKFESTPDAERHQSVAPNGGGGRSAPPNGGKSIGGSYQKTNLPEFRQYEGDSGVPGGQLTLDLIAA